MKFHILFSFILWLNRISGLVCMEETKKSRAGYSMDVCANTVQLVHNNKNNNICQASALYAHSQVAKCLLTSDRLIRSASSKPIFSLCICLQRPLLSVIIIIIITIDVIINRQYCFTSTRLYIVSWYS